MERFSSGTWRCDESVHGLASSVAGREHRLLIRRPLARDGGSDDWSVLLWDLHSGSGRVLLERGPGPALALAFSQDGAILATSSYAEHCVRLWDLKTPGTRRVIARHDRAITSASFSPDGSLLATTGNDGLLGLWTVETGERLA